MRKTFKRSLALVLAMLMLLTIAPLGFAETVNPATCDHNYNVVQEVPASHEADGLRKHYKCDKCGSLFVKNASGGFDPVTLDELRTTVHTFDEKPEFVFTPDPKKGYTCVAVFTCNVCDREVSIPAVVTSEITKQASCTEKGEKTYTATVTSNGQTYTDEKKDPVDMVAHKFVFNEETEANCRENGHIAYYSCENCDKVFKSNDPHTETTMEFLESTKLKSADPKLKDRTEHTDSLKNVKYSYKDGKRVAYNCLLGGFEAHFCSYCEQEYSPEPIAAKNHVDDNFSRVEPTCTEPGRTAYTACKVCGYSAAPAEVLGALGHEKETVPAVDSTCTVAGNIKYWKCKRCGDLFKDSDLTHGYREDEEGNPIAKLDDEGKPVKDENGNIVYEKLTAEDFARPFAKHDLKLDSQRVDAECIKNGSAAVYQCKTCNQKFREYQKEKGDEIPDDAFVNNGDRTTYKDDPDYAVYYKNTTDTTIKMLNHIWVQDIRENSVGYVAPKCNAEGSCIATCSRCGSKTTLSLDKIPHISKQMLKEMPATCERGAYEIHRCAVCNETYELDLYDAEKPDINADKAPIGHTWSGEVTVVREATCTEKGLKGRRCLNGCGKAKDTVEIAMIPHKLKDVKVDPTCTEDGYTAKQCEMCGQLFEKKTISNLNGHIDANKDAKCDRCGELLCDHICHKTDIFSKLVWFIAKLWYQYLGINQTCKCGVPHYDPPKTPTT